MSTKTLKDKIVSKEEWEELARRKGYLTSLGDLTDHVGNSYRPPWWAARESTRLIGGDAFYGQSGVTAWINSRSHAYVHISSLDETKVAYTPDKVMGEADKQLQISLGKLIGRLFPLMPDDVLATMVAHHMAEVCGVVEYIEGPEAIVEAYTSLAGSTVGACMSKSDSLFRHGQPVQVYGHIPGVKLAVMRNEAGGIIARSLVWDVSETDKRYIRTYGNVKVLKRKLENAGYITGSWVGAKFPALPVEVNGLTAYIMPYLDGMNNRANGNCCTVILKQGHIVVLDEKAVNTYKRALISNDYPVDIYMKVATTTCGYIYLEEVPESLFNAVDIISGETYNVLEHEACDVFYNGQFGKTITDVDHFRAARWYHPKRGGITVLTPAENVVLVEFSNYVNDEQSLIRYYWVRLSAKFYPEDQTWKSRHGGSFTQVDIDGEEHWMRKKDCFTEVYGMHERRYKPISTLTKKHVKLHTAEDIEAYAAPDTQVFKTASNRKVHPAVSDVTQIYDGSYEFERNTKYIHILGYSLKMHKSTNEYGAGTPVHNKALEMVKSDVTHRLYNYERYSWFRSCMARGMSKVWTGNVNIPFGSAARGWVANPDYFSASTVALRGTELTVEQSIELMRLIPDDTAVPAVAMLRDFCISEMQRVKLEKDAEAAEEARLSAERAEVRRAFERTLSSSTVIATATTVAPALFSGTGTGTSIYSVTGTASTQTATHYIAAVNSQPVSPLVTTDGVFVNAAGNLELAPETEVVPLQVAPHVAQALEALPEGTAQEVVTSVLTEALTRHAAETWPFAINSPASPVMLTTAVADEALTDAEAQHALEQVQVMQAAPLSAPNPDFGVVETADNLQP